MTGLDKVSVAISVVLGGRNLPLGEVLRFGRGAIIDLDMLADDEVTLCANGLPVAQGRLLTDGDGAIRVEITRLLEIQDTDRRMAA